MASEASTSSAPTQSRPLFPLEPVEYMRIETGDGHLFLFDKEAAQRSSKTLKGMIEAQDALEHAGTSEQKPISLRLEENGTRAIEGVINFLYWRKRWINVITEKIPEWRAPRDNQPLIQEMVVAAHFLEV